MRFIQEIVSYPLGGAGKQGVWCLPFNWETKAKVIVVALEPGKGRNDSRDSGYHQRPSGTKGGFRGFADEERLCLYYRVDFFFVPEQSHSARVLIYTPQMMTDLCYFCSPSKMTLFIATETMKNSWLLARMSSSLSEVSITHN